MLAEMCIENSIFLQSRSSYHSQKQVRVCPPQDDWHNRWGHYKVLLDDILRDFHQAMEARGNSAGGHKLNDKLSCVRLWMCLRREVFQRACGEAEETQCESIESIESKSSVIWVLWRLFRAVVSSMSSICVWKKYLYFIRNVSESNLNGSFSEQSFNFPTIWLVGSKRTWDPTMKMLSESSVIAGFMEKQMAFRYDWPMVGKSNNFRESTDL